MYGLHGKITAQPGQRDALIGYLLENAHDMPGCHLYVVSTDPADRDAIWVYEVWETQADHLNSLKLEGVQRVIGLARPLIAGMSDRVEFNPVGGKGLPR